MLEVEWEDVSFHQMRKKKDLVCFITLHNLHAFEIQLQFYLELKGVKFKCLSLGYVETCAIKAAAGWSLNPSLPCRAAVC